MCEEDAKLNVAKVLQFFKDCLTDGREEPVLKFIEAVLVAAADNTDYDELGIEVSELVDMTEKAVG